MSMRGSAGDAARHDSDGSDAGWISRLMVPEDYRGPVDVPFVPLIDADVERPVIDVLRGVVHRDPLAVAVQRESGAVSYGQMWRAVARLAAVLEAHPSRPAIVGVLLAFSAEWWVAMLACNAAGRIVVPLDPTQPAGRLADVVSAAGIDLILVDDTTRVVSPPCQILSVSPCLDDHAAVPPLPRLSFTIDDPAYIICTSGSTGRPKAIVRSQRSMLHVARVNINAMHLSSTDRMMSVASPATLGGVINLFRIALSGASFYPIDMGKGGLRTLFTLLESERITVLHAGASLLRVIAGLPHAERALSKLRLILSGGEPLMKTDLEALRRLLPPTCLIYTIYGSTEAGAISWFANGPDSYHPVRVATGMLAPHEEAMVVDDEGRPCPPGVAGELIMRSRYYALGEWVDGQLVPGRLTPDPARPALSVYATGDLAQYSKDGVFVILGRQDRQVKVNGRRVEPGEIEAILRGQSEVAQVAVIARQTGPAAMIHAFVVPGGTAPPDLEQRLRDILRQRLPAFMVPARIFIVERFPLLPGGKLDEAAMLAGL